MLQAKDRVVSQLWLSCKHLHSPSGRNLLMRLTGTLVVWAVQLGL